MSISTIGRRLEKALRVTKSRWDDRIVSDIISEDITGLSHDSAMVWTYHPFNLLEKSDFQSVDSSVSIKDIIKCRFGMNMKRTDHYLIRFDSPSEMERYTSNVIRHDSKIIGRPLTLATIDNVPMVSLRSVYPPVIPELRDLRDIFHYKSKEEVDIMISQKINQLTRSKERQAHMGIPFNDYDSLLKKTQTLKQDLQSKSMSAGTIDRSQCVVLSNFNCKIDKERILDMVWDLKLHDDQPIRRVMVHPATLLATDVVIFKTKEDAICGVHRWNRCHALYNNDMPNTTAELL